VVQWTQNDRQTVISTLSSFKKKKLPGGKGPPISPLHLISKRKVKKGKIYENNAKNSIITWMFGTGWLTRSPLTLDIFFYYGHIPKKLKEILTNVWEK
jgi:hypothetical protein